MSKNPTYEVSWVLSPGAYQGKLYSYKTELVTLVRTLLFNGASEIYVSQVSLTKEERGDA